MCPVPPSQVAGRASLKATTLKSLGLTGGSAIIRWGPQSPSSGKQEEGQREWAPPRRLWPWPLDLGPWPEGCPFPGGLCGSSWLGGRGLAAPAGGQRITCGARRPRQGGAPCGGSLALGLHPQVCHEAMQLCWPFTEQSPRKPYRLAVGWPGCQQPSAPAGFSGAQPGGREPSG